MAVEENLKIKILHPSVTILIKLNFKWIVWNLKNDNYISCKHIIILITIETFY